NYQKSLEIAEQLQEKQIVVNALGNIGNLLGNEGKYTEAERYYQRALHLQEELGNNPALVAITLINLGGVEDIRDNLAGAMAYYQQALSRIEKGDDLRLLPIISLNIGKLLARLHDYRGAMDYYRRSLKMSTKLGARDTSCSTLEAIGVLELREGRFDAALKKLTESLQIARERGDKG